MKLTYDSLRAALPSGILYVWHDDQLSATLLRDASMCHVFNLYEGSYTFSMDSRTIVSSEIFIALKGVHVDGHQFITDALKQGARGLMINAEHSALCSYLLSEYRQQIFIIVVEDTTQALIDLARYNRAMFFKPIAGITGSVGKTTTKEMVRAILKKAGMNACVSYKNQNTLIGLALNLLKLEDAHDVGIFEVGINEIGEMAQLVALLKPTVALITAIGHAHAKGLGSLTAIAREKRILFSLLAHDQIGIIPGDVAQLSSSSYAHPVIRFGHKMRNHVQARAIKHLNNQLHFTLRVYNDAMPLVLNSPNAVTIDNALAATALTHVLGVGMNDIVKALHNFIPVAGRFLVHTITQGYGTVIDDSYNANPESMKAALRTFAALSHQGSKIAVLGDMLELGAQEIFWHRQIGRYISKTNLLLDHLILIGPRAAHIAFTLSISCTVHYASTWQEAYDVVRSLLSPTTLLLVKGSRSIGLGALVQKIMSSPV